MSKNPKLPPDKRIEIIKRELPRGTTQNEIAVLCGVCVDTISRDMKAWRLSGGWDAWIRTRFHDMVDPAEELDFMGTFREIGKLAARTMTQRTESKIEGFGTLKIWRPGEEPEPTGEGDEDQKT